MRVWTLFYIIILFYIDVYYYLKCFSCFYILVCLVRCVQYRSVQCMFTLQQNIVVTSYLSAYFGLLIYGNENLILQLNSLLKNSGLK